MINVESLRRISMIALYQRRGLQEVADYWLEVEAEGVHSPSRIEELVRAHFSTIEDLQIFCRHSKRWMTRREHAGIHQRDRIDRLHVEIVSL